MPRNIGTGIYTIPPDTEGIPDQTIESVPYNFYIHDVETDLNNPRPIIAGGTGANDADEALFNLSGEKATQLVDNYNSWIWMPGSFRSTSSAIGGPVDGHAFAGVVYINEPLANPPTNSNVLVSARDMNDTFVPGRVYVREKKAGVWGPWTIFDPSIYAPIDSPVFTGDARAPTPLVNDADTTIATTSFVQQLVANSVVGINVDALAYNGIQINGAMDVNQEKPYAVTTTANGGYVADGWKLGLVGTMTVQAGTGVDVLGTPKGFRNVLILDTLTAQTSLGTNDTLHIVQPIEGIRIAKLAWGTANAQSITIGFWSANPAGIYSVAVGTAGRVYCTTYTQATTNVMQYNTIVVPGCTDGTWSIDNSMGMSLYFTAAAGSAKIAPAPNVWNASTLYVAAPGQMNGAATVGRTLFITGVVILPGVVSIPAARSSFVVRSGDQELEVCKRYFQRIGGTATGTDLQFGFYAAVGGADHWSTIPISPSMRATPAISQTGSWVSTNVSLITLNKTSVNAFVWQLTSAAAGATINQNLSATPPIIGGSFILNARL